MALTSECEHVPRTLPPQRCRGRRATAGSQWLSNPLVRQPSHQGGNRALILPSGSPYSGENKRAWQSAMAWRGGGEGHSEEECSECLEEVELREWCPACLSSAGGTEATGLSGRSPLSPPASFVFESVYFSFYNAPWLPQVNKL